MKKITILLLFLIQLTLVFAQRKESSAYNYIEKYKTLAIEEMKLTGIPASITLAQALHESANGTSQLAVYANNHFGVKCSSNWKGKKFYRNNNRRNNCFRDYETVEEAYKDRSRFLSVNKKYAFLFQYGPTEYKKWAHGLQRSGYAASKTYATHLLKTIKLYELHQYDLLFGIPDTDTAGLDSLDSVNLIVDSISSNTIIKANESFRKKVVKSFSNSKIYKVKNGDSLYVIARKYHTSVNAIRKLNHLKSNLIHPGQRIKIPE